MGSLFGPSWSSSRLAEVKSIGELVRNILKHMRRSKGDFFSSFIERNKIAIDVSPYELLRVKNFFPDSFSVLFDLMEGSQLGDWFSNKEIYTIVYRWLRDNMSKSQLCEGWKVLTDYHASYFWQMKKPLLRQNVILLLSMAELQLNNDQENPELEDDLATVIQRIFISNLHELNSVFDTIWLPVMQYKADFLIVCFDLLNITTSKRLILGLVKQISHHRKEELDLILYAHKLMTDFKITDAESLSELTNKYRESKLPGTDKCSHDLKEFIQIMHQSQIVKTASVELLNHLWVLFILRKENCTDQWRYMYDLGLHDNSFEKFILKKFGEFLVVYSFESGSKKKLEKKVEFLKCCISVVDLVQRNKSNYDDIWNKKEHFYLNKKQLQKETDKILLLVLLMFVMMMICSSGQHKSAKLKKYLTLKYEYAISILYLLWCSGDIEINPGPPLRTKLLRHYSEKERHWILNIVPILLRCYWKHTQNSMPKNLWQQKPHDWPESKPFYDIKNKSKDYTGGPISDKDLLKCSIECCNKWQVPLSKNILDEISAWQTENLQLLFRLHILHIESDKILSSVQEIICHADDNDLQQKLTNMAISLNTHVKILSLTPQETKNTNIDREMAVILCKIVNGKDLYLKCEGIWDQLPDGWPPEIVIFDPNNRAKYKKKYPDRELCPNKKLVETFMQLPILEIKMTMPEYIMYKPLFDAYQVMVKSTTAKEVKKCKEILLGLFHIHTGTMKLDFSLTHLHEAGLFNQEVHEVLTRWWKDHDIYHNDENKLSNIQIHGERPHIYIDVFQNSIRVSIQVQDLDSNVTILFGYHIPFITSKGISSSSVCHNVSQAQQELQSGLARTLSFTSFDSDNQPRTSKANDSPIDNSRNQQYIDILPQLTDTHLETQIPNNEITVSNLSESDQESRHSTAQLGPDTCIAHGTAELHNQKEVIEELDIKCIGFNSTTKAVIKIPPVPSDIKEASHTLEVAAVDSHSYTTISNGSCTEDKLKIVQAEQSTKSNTSDNVTTRTSCQSGLLTSLEISPTNWNTAVIRQETLDRSPNTQTNGDNATGKKRKSSIDQSSFSCDEKLQRIENTITIPELDQMINDLNSKLMEENNLDSPLINIGEENSSSVTESEQTANNLEEYLKDLINDESEMQLEIDKLLDDQTSSP